MKRIHYLLLGLLVSLTIAAVSPGLPPTRIIAGDSTVVVVTNGVNNFTLTASGGVGTSNGLATNLTVYSSGTTNRALRVFGTNGTSEVYVDKDARLLLPDGSAAAPAAAFGSATDTGAYLDSGVFNIAINGTRRMALAGAFIQLDINGLYMAASNPFFYLDGTYLLRDADQVIAQRNGTSSPQTNRLYHTYTDGSNHQRLALYTTTNSVNIAAETAGTGAANLDVNLITAGTGKVVLNDNGLVMGKTITAPATTGNQTINKAAGRVNIAAAGTTVVVTCSLATANSIIIAVAATADATAMVTSVVPAAGSFTINTVATTAETAFNFIIIN